jgi:hypothetical protein
LGLDGDFVANNFLEQVLDIDPKEFPENAFGFDIVIPDGTRVWVREKPGQFPFDGNYEWVVGKIRERAGK